MDITEIEAAAKLERKRYLHVLLTVLYGATAACVLLLLPIASPAPTLVILAIFGSVAAWDLRRARRDAAKDSLTIAETVAHTQAHIVAAAARHYHIEALEPVDGWNLTTVLGMCGRLEGMVPKAKARIAGGRELDVSVFFDAADLRTVLVAADADDHDMLDIIRRY